MKLKKFFKRHRTGEIVVKRRISPRLKLFFVALSVVLVIVAGGAIYHYGMSSAGYTAFATIQQQGALRDEIKRLRDENIDLRETLARAQRTLQMDQVAYQELDRSLKESAKEINRQREELSFYRNIISPADKVGGIKIERLNVERATAGENLYRYKLVLVQALKHESTLYGRAQLEVYGALDGKDTILNFPSGGDKPHSLNFRYFQELEGNLRLPRNFQPVRIKVTIYITSPVGQTLEQNYAWPRL